MPHFLVGPRVPYEERKDLGRYTEEGDWLTAPVPTYVEADDGLTAVERVTGERAWWFLEIGPTTAELLR